MVSIFIQLNFENMLHIYETYIIHYVIENVD